MTAEITILTGSTISAGAAFGYVLREEPLESLSTDVPDVPPGQIEQEVTRLGNAFVRVRATLEEHVRDDHAPHDADHEQILAAHALMLEDEHFTRSIVDRIRSDGVPAEHAVERAFANVANRLVISGDPYLRARAEEIRDLCQGLRRALRDADRSRESGRTRSPTVYVSAYLGATGVLRARRASAVAFVTSSTALTSHGAILLRATGIPALGGVDLTASPLENGTPVLVNASDGRLVIRPDAEQLEVVARRVPARARQRGDVQTTPRVIDLEDGSSVRLYANIDHPSQVGLCLQQRLSGVGLFRTEFLVLEAGRVPCEEDQLARYRSVLDELGSLPLVIRSFDLGGDKTVAGLHQCTGPNPALGVRGVRRHILRYPEELKTQFSAILRAARGHRVSVLLPMVTNASDVKAARILLDSARNDLLRTGEEFGADVRLGAMIEVPSAALNLADILAQVDFVSIGTNDMLQYLTAADRDNEQVLHYYEATTSGLDTLLEFVMGAALALGRQNDIAVCGELASTPEGAELLVRIGIRSLSISPGAAPKIRETLGSGNGTSADT